MLPGIRVRGPQTVFHPDEVGAHHAAVEDIAHDRDLETVEVAQFFPDGKDVQQRLGGMRVASVSAVDHGLSGIFVHKLRAAGTAVPDAVKVDAHSVQRVNRVLQAFALLQRGDRSLEADHIGAEAVGGEFEAHPGAGAVLHKKRANGLAAQGGNFLVLAEVDLLHALGGFQDVHDFFR